MPKESIQTTATNQPIEDKLEDKNGKFLEMEKDVKGLIRLMIDKIGVDIPEADWPKVNFRDVATGLTCYVGVSNTIVICGDHFDNGATYGEEIAHFIRHYLYPNDIGGENQIAVGEFFGRLGENIAREAARGTELERLFLEKERSHFGNQELLNEVQKDISEIGLRVKSLTEALEKSSKLRREAVKNIKDFYRKVEEAQEKYKQAEYDNVLSEDLIVDLVLYLNDSRLDLLEFTKPLLASGQYPDWVNSLATIIIAATNDLRSIK